MTRIKLNEHNEFFDFGKWTKFLVIGIRLHNIPDVYVNYAIINWDLKLKIIRPQKVLFFLSITSWSHPYLQHGNYMGRKKNNLDEVNTQNFPPFSSINKNLITIIYPLSKFIKKRDQEHLRRYLQHQAVGFHILKPATLRAVYTMYKSLGNKGRHTKHDDELLNKCLSVSKFSSASILQNLQKQCF